MPQNIRSILGKARITKQKPRSSSAHAAQSSTSSSSSSPRRRRRPPPQEPESEHDALFPLRFSDLGAAPVLSAREELGPSVSVSPRDVPQAMRYIRARMFSAVPRSGLPSGRRTAEVLNRRASMPPLVTTGHVHAVLAGPPGRTEREIAELVGRGVLRRVRVERRGGAGEALIETRDLEEMLRRADVSDGAAACPAGGPRGADVGGGGAPALAARGGGRAAFRVAVPGHGGYLKLADGAVDWVREALGRTRWGEGPESWLKERFEGNGLYGTRWKEFWGVEWEWVLGQAVGLGVVELFETGSVGRGVRLLGG
ncbi:Serine-threonine protein kinase 19 [Metarhizium album ARSEF 1941]|uniref:Serine-threonine protein kinase 19 n=1 Tax=Metarhizium album (strain ARSEF 1941) TaxID=1081103 RepID=A0A0B2WUX2_METAS|nr:Serine-threonine protein kinase 19 [Metarhizium album ARSEF 1941]KHN99886.1 Serine-threonine protein kinase 19 [Metarhizium album ARSEF 1941]